MHALTNAFVGIETLMLFLSHSSRWMSSFRCATVARSRAKREAAWADYYAANGGGDGYQSAGGQQHHQMHHRRHHAEGYYDDAHPSSSPWSEWDAYHHGGDAGVDDHGHYDYGGDPYGRYAPPPPP